MIVNFNQALDLLNNNEVVAIPTETVYGLAGNGLNDQAVAKIYAIKMRPTFNPLIMHIHDLETVANMIMLPKIFEEICDTFWLKHPAPLTIVVNTTPEAKFSKLALGGKVSGQSTVALRRPNHPLALQLLREFKRPIAAPSANYSNRLSATCPNHITQNMNSVIPILDGGSCKVGLESTIIGLAYDTQIPLNINNIDCHFFGSSFDKFKPTIIVYRSGAVTHEQLATFANLIDYADFKQLNKISNGLVLPGSLNKHYAPSKPLLLNIREATPGMGVLCFGSHHNFGSDHAFDSGAELVSLNLSPKGCLTEAASNLFNYLDILDHDRRCTSIGVTPIPNKLLGKAINDRLSRAAN